MQRTYPLFLLTILLAIGCGPAGFVYDEGEALRKASAPAAVPGFLGLLPAKKGEALDPGEVEAGRPEWRWGVHAGALLPLNIGGDAAHYNLGPLVRGSCRWGADRANRIGVDLSFAYAELSEQENAEVEFMDSTAREFMLRVRGIVGVGPYYYGYHLTAGMQLVYEDVDIPGRDGEGHFGVTVEIGENVRIWKGIELDFSVSLLLGADSLTEELTLGVTF